MSRDSINTEELVEQMLSVMPLFAKKLFGPVHILHDSDLHHTHFHIMHLIDDAGSIRTTDIARKLAIKKSNLSPMLQKLTTKEFILRKKDPADRRVIYIELTRAGQSFLEEKKVVLQKEVEERLSALPSEDKKTLQEAVGSLQSVLSKLEG